MRTRIAHPSALLLLTAIASAQTDLSSRLRPITSPVRDAGTYHVATGTWTRRKAPSAALGLFIAYDNTCSGAQYAAMSPGEVFTDEGRLPSTTSPNNAESKPGYLSEGCPDGYFVNGFEIAYCTDGVAPESANITFTCQYAACDDPTLWSSQVAASFALTGLPASPTGNSLACWIVTLDLESPPQSTSLGFELGADGDGAYGTIDTFGWSMEYPSTMGNTGPVIAGDPAVCSRWGNTIWSPIQPSPETAGTGMGTEDRFRLDGGTAANPGCYWFGAGTPMSSFWLRISEDFQPDIDSAVTSVCFGSPLNCPCGATVQSGTDGQGGCDPSWGGGGVKLRMGAIVQASIADDTDGTPWAGVHVTRGPTSGSSLLLFQGTTLNSPVPTFGDGLRCPGGDLVRIATRSFGAAGGSPAGEIVFPPGTFGPGGDQPLAEAGELTSEGVRYYQGWFRNIADFCMSQGFNLTNALEVTWVP